MRLLTILIILIITGCGSEYEPLVEWSGDEVERSERFILNYDTDKFPESQLPKVEQWWIDVQECVGVSIDISDRPLIIEYAKREMIPTGTNGVIDFNTKYSRIVKSDLILRKGKTTKHEMIHYLTFLIDGRATDENINHDHLFFQMCD